MMMSIWFKESEMNNMSSRVTRVLWLMLQGSASTLKPLNALNQGGRTTLNFSSTCFSEQSNGIFVM